MSKTRQFSQGTAPNMVGEDTGQAETQMGPFTRLGKIRVDGCGPESSVG